MTAGAALDRRRAAADRRRRVRERVEPAGPGRGRRPAARSAARSRSCSRTARAPALDWAAEQGIETALVPGGDDATLAETLAAVAPDAVVLAGYLRVVGPAVLERFEGRILNVHPSLLPSFPGLHAVRDALAAGVAMTGVTVHLVDATLDGGPIVAQEAVPVLPGDDEATLLERLHAVEHRLLPTAVAALLAGAVRAGGRASRVARSRRRRRQRAGAAPRAAVGLGQGGPRRPRRRARRARLRAGQHRGHRPGAARGRPAGHRRRRGHRLPRDARRAREDAPSAGPRRPARRPPARRPSRGARRGRASPRSSSSSSTSTRSPRPPRRPGLSFDELVEEIDIGGPSMVRAAAKNHASVAIVTSPARYDAVLAALDEHGDDPAGPAIGARRRGVRAHRRLRRPDRRGAAVPDARRGRRPARRSPGCPVPRTRIRRC